MSFEGGGVEVWAEAGQAGEVDRLGVWSETGQTGVGG